MSKDYQKEQLRQLLINPTLKSGLYLIDTDLSDEEIETFIKSTGWCSYEKEILIPTSEGSVFELFVIGLSYKCENKEISEKREQCLHVNGKQREIVLYSLVILMMRHLCSGDKSILHIQGELDFTSFSNEELWKLKASLDHHQVTTLVISKNKSRAVYDSKLNKVSFKEVNKYRLMENRLEKVHISYKHDADYETAIEAIKKGFIDNGIEFSIDEYDIMYRGNIEEYEKEIGASDRVVMFVISSYLKSLDCMFEMTQLFKNGNIREHIFPIVDMKTIPRNGDGLKQIKDYWQKEKVRKSEQIKTEPGGSTFVLGEIQKIDDILKTMDDLWEYLVHINTGNYEKLIENDAALLIKELRNTLPKVAVSIDEKFVPSRDTMPAGFRTITQNGEKSLNIENNYGNIIIH